MIDVQKKLDSRGIPINHAGVKDLRYPITVLDRQNEKQHTVARLSMSVSLPHHFKGTHMSRFIEVLNDHRGEITMRTLPTILRELQARLHAESAMVQVEFPYFLERIAPVSGAIGLMDYECSFSGEIENSIEDFVLGVKVPVTSLCPCSKEISDYSAHNQRGCISIQVRSKTSNTGLPALIWIEELVEVAEQSASAPVYALLKREDERYVTMQAYDNPVFVEDMVRNVADKLQDDSRIGWFEAYAINQESIHNHSAFARVEWTRSKEDKKSMVRSSAYAVKG